MISKPFAEIGKGDIDALILGQAPESRTLDYKQESYGTSDGEKKEMLADVCAFANAAGGDLVLGVTEARDGNNKLTGLPSSADGVAGVSAGAETLRLEQIIQGGISPKVPGVHIKSIEGFPNGPVILIRIDRSIVRPHVVTLGGSFRFFIRNNGGKTPMDVEQIRAAFMEASSQQDRITRFRDERIKKILADQTPATLLPRVPRFVLHLLPLRAFDFGAPISAPNYAKHPGLGTLHYGGGRKRFNFDGRLSMTSADSIPPSSEAYTQLYRNGIIEAVETSYFGNFDNDKWIRGGMLATDIRTRVAEYLHAESALGVDPPYFLSVSVLNASGYKIFQRGIAWGAIAEVSIDRDEFTVPEVLIDDLAASLERPIRDILDAIWQAAGWPEWAEDQ